MQVYSSRCITSDSFVSYFTRKSRKIIKKKTPSVKLRCDSLISVRTRVSGGGRRGGRGEKAQPRSQIHATRDRGGRVVSRRWWKRLGGSGWFDMGLHIIKPTPVFMVESHPRYLVVCTHSSFLRSPSSPALSLLARHRAIKFGNSIPPAARSRTHVRVIARYARPTRRFRSAARARFCRLKPTAFYKRIKVNGGGAPSAIPREAHPSDPVTPRGTVIRACARDSRPPPPPPLPRRREGCRCQDRIFVYSPRRICISYVRGIWPRRRGVSTRAIPW